MRVLPVFEGRAGTPEGVVCQFSPNKNPSREFKCLSGTGGFRYFPPITKGIAGREPKGTRTGFFFGAPGGVLSLLTKTATKLPVLPGAILAASASSTSVYTVSVHGKILERDAFRRVQQLDFLRVHRRIAGNAECQPRGLLPCVQPDGFDAFYFIVGQPGKLPLLRQRENN